MNMDIVAFKYDGASNAHCVASPPSKDGGAKTGPRSLQKGQSGDALLEVETTGSYLEKPVQRPRNSFCSVTKTPSKGSSAGCFAPFLFLCKKLQSKKPRQVADELTLDNCATGPFSVPPSPDAAALSCHPPPSPKLSRLAQLSEAAEAVLLSTPAEHLCVAHALDDAVRDVLDRGMERAIKDSCLALPFGQDLDTLEQAFRKSIRGCVQAACRGNVDRALCNMLELIGKAEEEVLASMKDHLLIMVCALQQSAPFSHLVPVKCPTEPQDPQLRGLVPHTLAYGAAYLVIFALSILANMTNFCCQAALKLRDRLKERAATGCRKSQATIPRADSLRRRVMLMRGTYTNCILQSFDQSLTVLKAALVESMHSPNTQ